jgi:hypothetical protein
MEGLKCFGRTMFGSEPISLFEMIVAVQWMDISVDRSVSFTNQDCDPL